MAQGITIVASPLVTRLYSPGEFGVFAVYFAVVSTFSAFAGLRYNFAIPLAEDDDEARSLLWLSIIATAALAFVVAGALLLGAGRPLTTWLGEPEFASLLWLVPLGFAAESCRMASRSSGIRAKEYRVLAQNDAGQASIRATLQVGGGLVSPTAGTLLAGDLIARSAAALVMTHRIVPRFLRSVGATTRAELWRVAFRFRRFPLLSAPAAALNSATLYIPTVMLAGRYGPQVAGFLALTQRIVAVPLLLLGSSILEVYFGRAAELRRTGAGVVKLFRKTLLALTVVSVAVLLPAGLLASLAIPLVFGDAWAEAATYLRLLLPMYLVQFVSTGISPTLTIMERQDLQLLREILRSAVMFGGLTLVLRTDSSPRSAVLILMGVGSVGYLLHIGASWCSVSRSASPAPVGVQ